MDENHGRFFPRMYAMYPLPLVYCRLCIYHFLSYSGSRRELASRPTLLECIQFQSADTYYTDIASSRLPNQRLPARPPLHEEFEILSSLDTFKAVVRICAFWLWPGGKLSVY